MKNWRCDWCFRTCSAKERPSTCSHCGGRPRKFTRVTTPLELREAAAASCSTESSAIEEIADVNDFRQNVGLKTNARSRGSSRSHFGSNVPTWKRQLSGARGAAAAALKRKKEKDS